MVKDVSGFLWLLKLGALLNLYFLAGTFALDGDAIDARIVVPARILFAVSAYRCLFPVWYKDNVVFHASPLSSIFVTRLLATFSEVAYIYLFSHVLRRLNVHDLGWVDALSWFMVFAVVVSQGFVWGAISSGRLALYFWEEVGWFLLFAANTLASAALWATTEASAEAAVLLPLNLLFGAGYLPWQLNHLRLLCADARDGRTSADARPPVTAATLADGLRRSLHERNRTSEARAWGGVVGLPWLAAY